MTTKATAQMGGLTRLEIDNRVDRICSRLSRHGYDAQIDDLRDLRDLALQAIDRDGIDRGELARALLQKFNKLGYMETASKIVDFVLDGGKRAD